MAETGTTRSRYKDTATFVGGRGRQYAPFELPAELADPAAPGAVVHRLVDDEAGFLDAVAVRYYGPGAEDLWWVIAFASGMVDVEAEAVAGRLVLVPPYDRVAAMLARAGTEGK